MVEDGTGTNLRNVDIISVFAQIAETSCLSERLVECFLRHAMGNHIFTVYLPGHVQHTASSRLLATDPYLKDAIALMSIEIWQGATRVTDMVRQFGDSGEPTEAPFTLVNEPGVGMWEHLAKHSERAKRFGGAMKFSVLWKAGVWSIWRMAILGIC